MSTRIRALGAIFGSGLLLEGLLRGIMDRHQQQGGQHHEREGGRHPHGQLFSSRLSSLKKRQSLPAAMILFGLDLIIPASRSRNE